MKLTIKQLGVSDHFPLLEIREFFRAVYVQLMRRSANKSLLWSLFLIWIRLDVTIDGLRDLSVD